MNYKKAVLGLLFIGSYLPMVFAQVVYSEPAFPTQTDDVKIYFDASKGNMALMGFAGDVFAHTGVITNNSAASNDWKQVQGNWGTADDRVKMTREGNDLYSISYNITDFYGILPGVMVEQLAFVFRNNTGSIVGRASDGSDIFLQVYTQSEGLLGLVNLPSPYTIYYRDELVQIDIQFNKAAQVSITDNGMAIFNDSIDHVQTSLTAASLGNHEVIIEASYNQQTYQDTFYYLVIDANESRADAPAGTIQGINYTENDSYIFYLTAPGKEHIFLLCPPNGYAPNSDYRLTQTVDGLGFWIELSKDVFENNQTTYQYRVDSDITIADPFSRVVLDPWNDDEVDSDVLEELPTYPSGITSGIVTAFDAEPKSFDWQVNDFVKPSKSDLVIYELLIRDFLEDHSYKSLLDTLGYLSRLGVTAIELMPIQEFEGNNSWGYNPSFHMAVDKYYGSRDQLKAVIDKCHELGMAVILDVVFNHAFSQSPLCQMYWNTASFRPASSSPYLNEVAKHPFNVGYDFNHESIYTKAWVKQVLSYWIEEFRFDGFRFDLSKGLTQKNSGSNSSIMAQYDQGRIDILKDYADHIWSIDSDSYMICEHFAENAEERVLSAYGMMLWANATHEFTEAAMGYSSSISGASYKSRDWDAPNLIAYAESHDEERIGYKINEFGNSNGDYNTKEIATFANRIIATNLVYLMIPGPKMLWQFGELGYDYSINRCENGTINNDCRLSKKPIRWDYQNETSRKDIFNNISAILNLRSSHDVFETADFVINNGSYSKRIFLDGDLMDVICLVNFDVESKTINPEFSQTGTWYEYFREETMSVSNTTEPITLEPGEYRLYLTEPIFIPQGTFVSTIEYNHPDIKISPNPINSTDQIIITKPSGMEVQSVYLTGIDGRVQHARIESTYNETIIFPTGMLSNGLYILSLQTNKGIYSEKVVIQR